jgi:hypothetical protein
MVGANINQPKSGRMGVAVVAAVSAAAMTMATTVAVTTAMAVAEMKAAVVVAMAAQTAAEVAADVAVMVAETAVVAAAATAAAAAVLVKWLVIFVRCQVTAIMAGRNSTTNSTKSRTVGFSQNRDIVDLVHKHPPYVECTRYSCNILLIYLKYNRWPQTQFNHGF